MDMLLLGHGAERTGPPVHLARMVGCAPSDVAARVLLANGGPLVAEMSLRADVTVVSNVSTDLVGSALRRSLGAGAVSRWDHALARRGVGAARSPAVVYVNGVSRPTAALLRAVRIDAPVLTHVHELGIGLDRTTDPEGLAHVLSSSSAFLAVSDAVAAELVDRRGVDPALITVEAALLPDPLPAGGPSQRALARSRLGVNGDAVVVGACGLTDWRKAPEMFCRLARDLADRCGDSRIVLKWIGGSSTGDIGWQLRHELASLGVDHMVSFIDEVAEPLELMAGLDIFVVTAREDAYPLAALEAASLGLPIVSFDNGGLREFVDSTVGAVVRWGDTVAMAEAVMSLANDDEVRRQTGVAAAARVRDRHEPTAAGKRVWAMLRCVAESAR